MNLVTLHNNVPSVSHKVIATNTGNQAVAISNIINKHKQDFEEFGKLHFKNEALVGSCTGQKTKTYFLNEQQATLLLTYLKNVPIVRAFKKELIREFYRLKEQTTNDPMRLIAQTLETLASQQAMIMQLFTQRASASEVFPHVDKPTSRLALRRLSNEEKFIAKARKVLKECDGLSQGDLLRAIGKAKADKTALHWLHGYDGIYWRANIIGSPIPRYSYSIIEEA